MAVGVRPANGEPVNTKPRLITSKKAGSRKPRGCVGLDRVRAAWIVPGILHQFKETWIESVTQFALPLARQLLLHFASGAAFGPFYSRPLRAMILTGRDNVADELVQLTEATGITPKSRIAIERLTFESDFRLFNPAAVVRAVHAQSPDCILIEASSTAVAEVKQHLRDFSGAYLCPYDAPAGDCIRLRLTGEQGKFFTLTGDQGLLLKMRHGEIFEPTGTRLNLAARLSAITKKDHGNAE